MSELKIQTVENNDERVALKYTQDVEPALIAAADARREDRERGAFQRSHEMKRTMVVPFVVLMQIERETGLSYLNKEDAKRISQILKGPDYAKFRCTDKARR
jgi:hypothetical protein